MAVVIPGSFSWFSRISRWRSWNCAELGNGHEVRDHTLTPQIWSVGEVGT